MNELDPREWTQYWEDTRDVTTFSVGADDGYDGDFVAFWREQINGQFSPIIDLACGNGAMVWVADQLAKENQFQLDITGIDSANISPFKTLGRSPANYPGIRFIGNNSIEELPFESDSVGMAISQYGLEYARFEKTIPELSRVLKSSARIALIMHTPDSVVLQGMNISHQELTLMLNEGNLAQLFNEMDALYKSHRSIQQIKTDPSYQNLMGQINRAIFPVTKRPLDTFTPIENSQRYQASLQLLINLFNAFAESNPKSKARGKQIAANIDKMHSIIRRAECMRAAAVSEERLEQFKTLMADHGFTLKVCEHMIYSDLDYGLKVVGER